MLGYTKETLLDAVKFHLGKISSDDIYDMNIPDCIGQGCFRTTFEIPEFPNIVFKLPMGEDGDWEESMCDSEVAIWKEAVAQEIYLFPETEYLGTVTLTSGEDMGVYAQARVDKVADRMWYHWDNKRTFRKEKQILRILTNKAIAEDKCSEILTRSDILSSTLLRFYGAEELLRISKFCAERGMRDFHLGNWGFKDKTPVIFDFGYCNDSVDYSNYSDDYSY